MKALENVLSFLDDLKDNNHKDWMDANKARYNEARNSFKSLVAEVINGIAQFDNNIVGTEAKDCIFRLNRDIRFSRDKSPYKTNFGASISLGGKKSPYAGYYIHIMPGQNFIGGGMYHPEATVLKKIRQEIDYNPNDLQQIIEHKPFKSTFGEIQGEALKTAPKGYPKDHPNIALLKMKSFYFLSEYNDKEIAQEHFVDDAVTKLKTLHPFIQYLNAALD